MRNFLILLLLLCSWVFVYPVDQESGLTGHDIMVRVDDRPDGDDRKSVMHMTLINKRGRKRQRTMLSYSRDYGKDRKNIMYFQEPADVKGTGFLSWEYDNPSKDDDRWLFLPALKKVRRISGSSKNDYFMGSDFTYDDMGARSVEDDTHTLLKEEQIDKRNCWVIRSVPRDKRSLYSSVIRWIDKETLLPVKAEYFNQGKTLLKVLKLEDCRLQNGIWTAFKWVMDNRQRKHQTVLEIKTMEYDTGIKDSMFRVSTLERGRIK
jgi:outer membrane lipoprotein-sorting protein